MSAGKSGPRQVSFTFPYGGRPIEVKIRYSDRRRLVISVHPDQQVTADAPLGYHEEVIHSKVRQRAPWILKQLGHFESYRPLPGLKRYLSGESFRFLGRQYRLKVVASEKEEAKLVGGFLFLHTRHPKSREAKSRLAEFWYRRSAKSVFTRRIAELSKKLGVDLEADFRWRLQTMKCKWGSCSRRGTITLNPELVKAPLSCIEYVIAHELCHLKELNHTKAFYRYLSQVLPDWQERKAKLDEVVLT